jgi:nitrogen fixation/metabolism regulation signal transduction histidine kinase
MSATPATRPPEDGTGFGLPVVAKVADTNGLSVRVTDGTTSGACVEVTGVGFLAG